MREICDLIIAENRRRSEVGQRTLFLVYDQVYRMLAFGDHKHVTPVLVVPEMAKYTLFTDAISKAFAGTGLRVGWLAGPPYIAARIKALMTHMGAWAPRPEQIGTAEFIVNLPAVDAYLTEFKAGIRLRLDRLYTAFSQWKADGLPIDVIPPQGAIFLSVKFDLEGRPGIPDESSVLTYLLEKAGCAVVPFSAFGDNTNRGWYRFSVGAVSVEEIDTCLPRLRAALIAASNPV
jgi:aspartate aminotransferase